MCFFIRDFLPTWEAGFLKKIDPTSGAGLPGGVVLGCRSAHLLVEGEQLPGARVLYTSATLTNFSRGKKRGVHFPSPPDPLRAGAQDPGSGESRERLGTERKDGSTIPGVGEDPLAGALSCGGEGSGIRDTTVNHERGGNFATQNYL